MPYRRLPNTDAARLRALRKAHFKGKELTPFELPFSQHTLNLLQSFLPSFETAIDQSKSALKSQVNRSNDYNRYYKKAKMYISHFIQVFGMAIQRGDIPEEQKEYFGFAGKEVKVPKLHSESDIIKWGERLIHGETNRRNSGLSPITNPTIAVVNVRYEQFLEALKHQKILQKNYHRSLEHVDNMRTEADKIILSIWDEVEKTFENLEPEEKRKNAEAFGLIYVFRRKELQKSQE